MADRGKYIDLTDIPKFAAPDILTLQARPTASNLIERTVGGGFMSYGQIWPRMGVIMAGYATDEWIVSECSSYKADWKNKAIQNAFQLLRDHFDGKGNWYRVPNIRKYVLGFWFKTCIKGFWAHQGKVYAVLINARKGQPLTRQDVRFLARGVYELHCIDDPANPIPLIVDLALHPEDKERQARAYIVPPDEALPLEVFESSIREFLAAMNLAGMAAPPPPAIEHVVDLFRR